MKKFPRKKEICLERQARVQLSRRRFKNKSGSHLTKTVDQKARTDTRCNPLLLSKRLQTYFSFPEIVHFFVLWKQTHRTSLRVLSFAGDKRSIFRFVFFYNTTFSGRACAPAQSRPEKVLFRNVQELRPLPISILDALFFIQILRDRDDKIICVTFMVYIFR